MGNPGFTNLATMVSSNLAILTSGTWPDLTTFDGVIVRPSASGIWVVGLAPSSGPLIQGSQAGTSSAVALPNQALTSGVVLEALSTNTSAVFVGGSTVTTSGSTQGLELQPTATSSFPVANLNQIYIVGNGQTITWAGL